MWHFLNFALPGPVKAKSGQPAAILLIVTTPITVPLLLYFKDFQTTLRHCRRGTASVVQWLRLPASTAEGVGLIPG